MDKKDVSKNRHILFFYSQRVLPPLLRHYILGVICIVACHGHIKKVEVVSVTFDTTPLGDEEVMTIPSAT